MPTKGCPFPGSKELFEVCRTIADRAAADPSLRLEAIDTGAVSRAANPDAPAVPLDDGHTALSLFLERARAAPGRAAEQTPGELPHGVVHALEPGVHAKASGRRELVRGIAAQQHAALHEALGDGGVELPQPA